MTQTQLSTTALQILAEIPVEIGRRLGSILEHDESLTDEEIAHLIIADLNQGQLWELGRLAVQKEVHRYRRQYVRAAERRAIRRWAQEAGIGRADHHRAIVERLALSPETNYLDALTADRGRMLEELNRPAQTLRLISDLLDSEFTFADGMSATWGDATIDEHASCAARLYRFATGTVETAKLHEDAIEMIRAAGVDNLRQLIRAQAAS